MPKDAHSWLGNRRSRNFASMSPSKTPPALKTTSALASSAAAVFALERSEIMTLGYHESQTDDVTGQLEKSILDFREPIQTAPQAAERMQPGNGSLHEPAEYTKTAAVLRVAGGQ